MSALTPVIRQEILISFFQQRRGGVTLKQIANHMAAKMGIDGNQYIARNFQRDKSAILKNYNVEIGYIKASNTYGIINSPAGTGAHSIAAFDLLNAVLQEENFAGHVLVDHRKAIGLAHLRPLLKAIENKVRVRFDYQEHDGVEITKRKAEPYALKEFKGYWYLLAMDLVDLEMKTFGLDKMGAVDITRKKFEHLELHDPQEMFKNCFGITSPYKGQQAEEVVLELTPRLYNYVKSYPLHDSQHDLDEIGPDGQRLVALNICLNYDLETEILGYGDQARVVSPEHFKKRIQERLKQALGNY